MSPMAVRTLSLAAASALLASCSLDFGHDYAVIVPWLINGVAPSEAQCREHGVARVRFSVLNRDYVPLEGPCGQGIEFDDGEQFGGFVTTDSFDFERRYEYELAMVDEQGRVVDGLRTTGNFRVYYDDYLPHLIDPIELFEPSGEVASVLASWTTGPDLAQGCADLGISDVALVVTTRTDPDFLQAIELDRAPCGSGQLTTAGAVLAEGHYFLQYRALTSSGALVDDSDVIEAIVDRPGELALDPVRFDGR
jgi:hypothetical protein